MVNKPLLNEKWDDDLYELDNPLPKWFLSAFIMAIIFSFSYWILYPAWPGFKGHTKGLLTWSSEEELRLSLEREKGFNIEYYKTVNNSSLEELRANNQIKEFIRATGFSVFSNRCSGCHGREGQGRKFYFPNLRDGDWLHGGTLEQIYNTIKRGQKNMMPKFIKDLDPINIEAVAEYVYSLSNATFNNEKAGKGKEVFFSEEYECYDCHGEDGTGDIEIGAPNLTDSIWLYGGNRKDIIKTVSYGRRGVMPSWETKLRDEDIKILTVYVEERGK